VEVVASLSQGGTAAAQCGLFTHKSVPVIFEPPCILFCPVQHSVIGFYNGAVKCLVRGKKWAFKPSATDDI